MNEEDPIDSLLARARAPVPEGLADRILSATRDDAAWRRFYWTDVAFAARRALLLSAAGLLVAVSAAAFAVLREPSREVPVAATEPKPRAKDAALDQIARLTESPRTLATEVERQAGGALFSPGAEDETGRE